MEILSSCGMFSLRKYPNESGVWLYYGEFPKQHLLESEFSDLELLMKTTMFE